MPFAMGLDEKEANAFLPEKVSMKKEEHIAAFFNPPGMDSLLAGVGPADVHNRDPRVLSLVKSGARVYGNGVLAEGSGSKVVFLQLVPWHFDHRKQQNLKKTFRRASYASARVLANMGVRGATPLLKRIKEPVGLFEKRWRTGLYLDEPTEWDYPYRFFRW